MAVSSEGASNVECTSYGAPAAEMPEINEGEVTPTNSEGEGIATLGPSPEQNNAGDEGQSSIGPYNSLNTSASFSMGAHNSLNSAISCPMGAYNSLNTSGSAAASACMARYSSYEAERRKAMSRRIFCVGGIGTLLVIAGTVLLAIEVENWILKTLSLLMIQAGICMWVSCPSSDFNLNRTLKRWWPLRILLSLSWASLAYVQPQPSIILSAWLALNHRDEKTLLKIPRDHLRDLCHLPDSTTLMSFYWMILYTSSLLSELESDRMRTAVFAPLGPLMACVWLRLRILHRRSGGLQGADPTVRFHFTVLMTSGSWGLLFAYDAVVNQRLEGLVHAVANTSSLLVVLLVGRGRLFNFLAKQFESSWATSDGAVMATLLASKENLLPGQTWWVHRSVPDEAFDEMDHRRNWEQAVVEVVKDEEIGVKLPSELEVRFVPYVTIGTTQEEMMDQAHRQLRGVPWGKLSPEFFESSAAADPSVVLSCPMGKRRPDFFLSHSWHDDPTLKYKVLDTVTQEFQQRVGRDPIFWVDKACIDQRRIVEGLKSLPINIVMCKRVLVVCGPTYLSRLWCMLELCTLMAFTCEKDAVERIDFRLLPGGTKSAREVLVEMLTFDVATARCYDPNEEEHIFRIINVVGADAMNEKMHQLAIAMLKTNLY